MKTIIYIFILLGTFVVLDRNMRLYLYLKYKGLQMEYGKIIKNIIKIIVLALLCILYYFFTLDFENILMLNISENIDESIKKEEEIDGMTEEISYYEKVKNWTYEKRYYIAGALVLVTGIIVLGYYYVNSGENGIEVENSESEDSEIEFSDMKSFIESSSDSEFSDMKSFIEPSFDSEVAKDLRIYDRIWAKINEGSSLWTERIWTDSELVDLIKSCSDFSESELKKKEDDLLGFAILEDRSNYKPTMHDSKVSSFIPEFVTAPGYVCIYDQDLADIILKMPLFKDTRCDYMQETELPERFKMLEHTAKTSFFFSEDRPWSYLGVEYFDFMHGMLHFIGKPISEFTLEDYELIDSLDVNEVEEIVNSVLINPDADATKFYDSDVWRRITEIDASYEEFQKEVAERDLATKLEEELEMERFKLDGLDPMSRHLQTLKRVAALKEQMDREEKLMKSLHTDEELD